MVIKDLTTYGKQAIARVKATCLANKWRFYLVLAALLGSAIYAKPQVFVDLWLTRDQQGQVLFHLGNYQQAAATFTDTRWRAFSQYGAQQFDHSARLYHQFEGVEEQFYAANALAHGEHYAKALVAYQHILENHPEHAGAQHNHAIMLDVIDELKGDSEEAPEEDDPPIESGNTSQSGEGEEQPAEPEQPPEQLNAEQLLRDDELNAMWLRQVQKDPALFLQSKFSAQAKRQSNDDSEKDHE